MPDSPPSSPEFDNELSASVWRRKYQYRRTGGDASEADIGQTWQRVAAAAASVEADPPQWHRRFLAALYGFGLLPAGRILASAGTDYAATLCNCFVMGDIDDSIEGIFERLKESALTMQRGGGIGLDFSTLRPSGQAAQQSGRTASGPVSFMRLWDAMCSTLLARGNRRGAMMGVLRCDHPDILEFIDAKRTAGALTNFNLSVQITEELIRAQDEQRDIELTFPGVAQGRLAAAVLWQRLIAAAYDTAEPGVLFIDRVNALNNLHYRERIAATNPCGEVPLPPYGACNLASINLAAHVREPFSGRAHLDLDTVARIARDAVRFLDNIIDISAFPLEAQATEAHATRRIGLGITGLADALIMLGLRYDSDAGRAAASTVLTLIRDEAYTASTALAAEKGAFPCFDRDAYLAGRYIERLPEPIRDRIARSGIRNSHLLAIAPAGSISILANNVSSGIEPVFAPQMQRVVLGEDRSSERHTVTDFACRLWAASGKRNGSQPPAFVSAHEMAAEDHLLMAAALQPLVDNSISKTVNVDENIERTEFGAIYRRAYDLGLKGCTVFRANAIRGAVLSETQAPGKIHCCVPDREGD